MTKEQRHGNKTLNRGQLHHLFIAAVMLYKKPSPNSVSKQIY